VNTDRMSINARRQRVAELLAIDPEERALAGRVSGALYGMGGLTLWSFLLLPTVSHAHPGWIIGISAAAALWGICSLVVIDWTRPRPWLIHGCSLAGFVVIGVAVASSGGSQSAAWAYLFLIVVFAAYFYRPAVAALYGLGCVATLALPLLYEANWSHGSLVSQLVVGGSSFLALTAAIAAGRQLMLRTRIRAELTASKQAALRRVATAVIDGQPSGAIFEQVAREAAALLRGGASGILRFDSPRQATVMGAWADRRGGHYKAGTTVTVLPGSDLARAWASGPPVHVAELAPDSPLGLLGYHSSIVAPVQLSGETWGAITVATEEPTRLGFRDEHQLMEFGDLLASAIASIDDRARLAAQALTDPLTGLANRRSLHERLAVEVARTERHGRTLSVAVLDIDHFKQINDFGGHEAGDEMLVAVAGVLIEHARTEDILGRFGGDEFAWVMPETTREQALVAVERARRLIGLSGSRPYRITLSAGICDTAVTSHPAQLLNYADTALYWSKIHGRDRAWIYDPQVTEELTPGGLLDNAERTQALLGLRALSRAIDAKDPATNGHSERVAALVAKLAHAAGWPPERGLLLREAALVHDVGKLGLPERLVAKPDLLTDAERELVREHVELAVRIVEGVLAPEQVDWIRSHHERPDAKGYPRGVGEAEIPEGAALLAVADAWEAMRTGRPYRPGKTPDAALAECARLMGTQFSRNAVGALMQLHSTGELDDEAERLLTGSSDPRG
jgi:diguanylate cyclase (GGDEF)-like protein/putative nucleotidyltransferase with HDIG domain